MGFSTKESLCFVLVFLGALSSAMGQNGQVGPVRPVTDQPMQRARATAPAVPHAASPRLLTPNEGLAILNAALDSRHLRTNYSADCSHFVHAIYEHAGLPYEYASSLDLYHGTAEFRRVAVPQVGDLAVWRGHAGIVVSPDQHSFYSRLRSGPGIDTYDSAYWRRRGQPRFFRYVEPIPDSKANSLIRSASWQPDRARQEDVTVEGSSSEDSEPGPEASWNSALDALPEQGQYRDTVTSSVIVVNSSRPKPEQIRSAFLQACQKSPPGGGNPAEMLKSTESVVAFENFAVKKVHTSGSHGWIEVQIDEVASIAGSEAEVRRQSVRQRWLLTRRDSASWSIALPENTIYLPQSVAVKVLAHAFAQLTDDTSENTSELQLKIQLARLLNSLLEN